jgi:hypothetical protein
MICWSDQSIDRLPFALVLLPATLLWQRAKQLVAYRGRRPDLRRPPRPCTLFYQPSCFC